MVEPEALGGDRMAIVQAQRIMANITAPAASTTLTSDGHFSTNTYAYEAILSQKMAQRQVLRWAVLF